MLPHGVITRASKVLIPSIHLASLRKFAASNISRLLPSGCFIGVALGFRLRPIHTTRVEGQDVIPLVENRIELVADGIDELDTTPTRTARVDDKVLCGIFGAHANQWDNEDFVPFVRVARVGRREVVHGYGDVAALQRMTRDLPAWLPRHVFALIFDSSCLMARNGSQPDRPMWYESIQEEQSRQGPG